jgi:hypothetical protein
MHVTDDQHRIESSRPEETRGIGNPYLVRPLDVAIPAEEDMLVAIQKGNVPGDIDPELGVQAAPDAAIIEIVDHDLEAGSPRQRPPERGKVLHGMSHEDRKSHIESPQEDRVEGRSELAPEIARV